MKVILKSDVSNLGRAGDVLKVKDGYARNFLFPKKLALPALSKSLKEWNHKKRIAQVRSQKAQEERNKIAQKIEGHKIFISKQASSKGKLFGSVTAFEIASQLAKDGFSIDKRFVLLKESIKSVGEYKLQVDLGENVQPTFVLVIQSEAPPSKEESSS